MHLKMDSFPSVQVLNCLMYKQGILDVLSQPQSVSKNLKLIKLIIIFRTIVIFMNKEDNRITF